MLPQQSINASIFPVLLDYIKKLENEFNSISEDRKNRLGRLANFVQSSLQESGTCSLNFICTHNSRRSHLSQIWASTAASYYGIDGVVTYSGGTEATAFNPRAVSALRNIGFEINHPEGENPKYEVQFASNIPALICFSKTFDDPINPSADFAAIMTCSEADANCPFIPGAKMRLPLTYEDPKVADGTPGERAKYAERTFQIGTELLYAFALLK